MYVGLQVTFFFLILIKLEFSRQAFEKYSKTKFNNIRHLGDEFLHED